jgi:peptidoglycan/LPS O-acetylase OafA/YrhL
MREHYHNLQALRGVACLMVVLFHLGNYEKLFGVRTPLFREIQWFGFAGVDLFFVLSGFLIASANRKYLGRPAAVPGFLFRRFWRIYPMYWVALAVAVAQFRLMNGNDPVVGTQPFWGPWFVLAPASTLNVFVVQSWTLVYEVMFYLAFAAVILLPPRLAAAAVHAWLAALCVALLGPEQNGLIGSHVLSPFVFEFLGGCLVARLAGRGPCRGGRTALVLGLGYAVAAMLLVHAHAGAPWDVAMYSPRTRVLVFGPAAVLIVYGLVASEGRWPRRVPRWLLRAGEASYSLYLLHGTVLLMGLYFGFFVPHSRLPHLLWLTGTFAGCLAVGLLANRFVEKPLLNLAKRKTAEPVPVPDVIRVEPPVREAA